MNYYVLNANDEIELFDTDKKRLQSTLKFKPELADEKIHQTTKEIVELDGHFVFADEHESELLEKAKAEKLEELDTIASQFDSYKCDNMYITSSVGGYRFNADIRSQTNLQGLISVLDDSSTTLYKDYDNEFRSLNKAQMQTIFSECILNGQNLYKIKWSLQAQIENATSIEELNQIEIVFPMMDFSKSYSDSEKETETDSDSEEEAETDSE